MKISKATMNVIRQYANWYNYGVIYRPSEDALTNALVELESKTDIGNALIELVEYYESGSARIGLARENLRQIGIDLVE